MAGFWGRWIGTGIGLIAALALLGACTTDAAEPAAGTVVIREDEAARPRVPSEPSAQLLREVRVFGNPAPLGAVQEQLGVAPVVLDLGPMTFDELGISLTLDFPAYWRLDYAQPGTFSITRPDAGLGALLPAVTFHRPIGFAPPPLVASGRLGGGSAAWDPDFELAEWIAAVPQVVVVDQGVIDVDGRSTAWFDVDVDPELGPTKGSCQPGSCVDFLWSGAHTYSVARDLERIRWYEIPDPQGPVIVFVSTSEEDFAEVVGDVHALLLSAEVGESAPHPIPHQTAYASILEIPANESWSFAGVPGVRLTAANYALVEQRPGQLTIWRVTRANADGPIGFVLPVATAAGAVVASVEDLVAAILELAETVESTADDEVLGRPATRIDFTHEGPGFLLLAAPRAGFASEEAAWPRHRHQRAWVLESPLGPAIIAASGATMLDLEWALEDIDWMLDGLSFCDAATESCAEPR